MSISAYIQIFTTQEQDTINKGVAPHTGAWIETDDGMILTKPCKVAPHTGAWIETGRVELGFN